MLKDLLKKGDYMVKIDLKDAYLTVPIWQNHQKYLRFLWRDSLLEFACLPFGLASAPRVFTKLLKPVLSILRQRGIRLIVYLDDILLMAPSVEQVLQHAASTLNLLEGLGFTVNYLKSVLVPSQQMEFLGSLVNSLDLSLSLPRDKIRKIQSKCQDLLNTPVTTVRELSKFLGLLSSSIQAVFPAPLHYRYLQQANKLCSQISQILRSCSPSRLGMPPRGTVVERQSSSMEWESPVPTINGLGHRDQCLTSRMGSLLSRDVDRRQVAPRRDFIPYQLPRIASRLTSHNVLRQEQSQGSGTTADGQHFSSNLHKQNGRDTLPHAILPSQKSMGLVPHPQYLGDSALHSRNTECRSGQGIESISRFQRLETSSRGFQPPPSEVGSPQYRPLCLPSLLPTRSVCKLASRPSSNSHGCIHPGLGDLSGLCLSSICPDRPMPSPNSEPAGVTHGVCSTSLASSALVSTTIRPVHRLPSPPTSSGRSTDPGKQNPPSQTPTASWVASVSRGYQTADISAQSREILLAAWRKNTTSAYSSAWTKWSSWCSQQVNVNPLSPSLTNVLDFLALQFHEGKEYRTVNVYRSALSAVLPLIDGHKAGSHPLVCQLLKGVFQLRPPQPRYATTWQVSKVVQYISSLGSNSNLSTKLLSYKLVGLLALTAPDRASGLAARDLRFRYFHPEGVQFKLPELTKTARQGQDPKSCFHASFPENEHLCVCKCLQEYEARTLQWRPQDPSKPNKLLLSHINPHKPVSPATLARWLKELMQLAGVDTSIFKGHSVRGAVATEAAKQGFSIPDILQFADWSQASTFTKFYYRPQFDTSPGRAILSSTTQI